MPLEGIRVLDLGTMTPGKYCTLMLADFGADVIRVERHTARTTKIDEEDLVLNRNKRSIGLNLRTEEGKQVFYRLARKADVILESNRPGVAKRLGVDYDTLRKMNPGIIYCSLSGFGQGGPYAQLPAFDMVFMAIGGLLGLFPGKGRPPLVPGIYVSDAGSGLLAVIGILLGVTAREKTGKGQYIDLAMLDGALSMLSIVSGGLRASGEPYKGDMPGMVMPGYNVYETRDGKHLALGIFRPRSWQTLCQALGREDFVEHQWATGSKQAEIFSFFEEVFRAKTRDEWCGQLRELDVEIGEVNSLPEVYSDPQVLHRQMVEEVDHPVAGKSRQIGIPIKLSETPGRIRRVAPCIGQDSEAILQELGYDKQQIDALTKAQAI
jgi:crotonobetainyl-CoA:carnitine CoA-transferase CaiB-like acyl-CoA transferase